MENNTILDISNAENNYTHAPVKIRFINLLLDTIFIYIILSIAFVIILLYDYSLSDSEFTIQMISFGIYLLYYFSFESTMGATPAKLITKTKVLTETFEKPNNSKIALRTICRIIPLDVISFLFNGNWHDNFSKTIVVKNK